MSIICVRFSVVASLLLGVLAAVSAQSPASKENLENQFRSLAKGFGSKNNHQIEVVAGPKPCQMNRKKTDGREWSLKFDKYKFRVSIEDGVKTDIDKVVKQLQRVPAPYFAAFVVVSEPGKNGVAVYANLDGAAAHGGKEYINIVPTADALVLVHEIGHSLEQVVTAKDAKTLDKWAAAIKADGISVSKYGDHVRHEDLAEFARIYAMCLDAGADTLAKLKQASPARFAIWENILNGKVSP